MILQSALKLDDKEEMAAAADNDTVEVEAP